MWEQMNVLAHKYTRRANERKKKFWEYTTTKMLMTLSNSCNTFLRIQLNEKLFSRYVFSFSLSLIASWYHVNCQQRGKKVSHILSSFDTRYARLYLSICVYERTVYVFHFTWIHPAWCMDARVKLYWEFKSKRSNAKKIHLPNWHMQCMFTLNRPVDLNRNIINNNVLKRVQRILYGKQHKQSTNNFSFIWCEIGMEWNKRARKNSGKNERNNQSW